MGAKNVANAHAVFGDTNRAGGVPGHLAPGEGPVYFEGKLVLSHSFQGGPIDAPMEDMGGLIERFRLWDDVSESWFGDSLEVQRFEMADIVMRTGARPVVLWKGSLDTRARVMPVPDIDEAGVSANRELDLCWKCV